MQNAAWRIAASGRVALSPSPGVVDQIPARRPIVAGIHQRGIMSRHVNAYRHVQAQSWTRVDMLLALYDKALLMVEAGIHLLEQGRFEDLPPARTQVQRLLLGLIEGMDLENDDTSRKMAQVLMFAIRRSSIDDPSAWRDALRIIQPLRDGFAEIRDQAVAAERRGEIPPLDWRTPVAFSA